MSTSQDRENVCAVLHGACDIRMEKRSCPTPGPGEVQIQLKATGLCGSDLSYYTKGKNGNFALKEPLILGHEFSGLITALGSEIPSDSPLKVGQRIAIEAGIYCRDCDRCNEGKYNLCKEMRFASSAKTLPHLDGSLQKFINWPYWLVHSLPDSLSFTSGALLEPLCVVLQAFSRSSLKENEKVLVIGAGAVGLLTCAAAKARGASSVVAIDIDSGRLDFAKNTGWADETYQIPLNENNGTVNEERKTRAEEDAEMISKAEKSSETFLKSLKDQREFDVVFECSGIMSSVQLGIFSTRPGGRVVLIGMGTPIQTVPIGASALREVDLQGVFRYANRYPEAIELLASGKLKAEGASGIEQLMSHSFSLEKTKEAFETLARGKSEDGRGVVKVFVVED